MSQSANRTPESSILHTSADGTQSWLLDSGQLHREDGPAAIRAGDGNEAWWRYNKLHREDGPAMIARDGMQRWLINGLLHREDGPAVIRADGTQIWYRHGEMHRENGPALIEGDGSKIYFLDDEELTRGAWEQRVAELPGS